MTNVNAFVFMQSVSFERISLVFDITTINKKNKSVNNAAVNIAAEHM